MPFSTECSFDKANESDGEIQNDVHDAVVPQTLAQGHEGYTTSKLGLQKLTQSSDDSLLL